MQEKARHKQYTGWGYLAATIVMVSVLIISSWAGAPWWVMSLAPLLPGLPLFWLAWCWERRRGSDYVESEYRRAVWFLVLLGLVSWIIALL